MILGVSYTNEAVNDSSGLLDVAGVLTRSHVQSNRRAQLGAEYSECLYEYGHRSSTS